MNGVDVGIAATEGDDAIRVPARRLDEAVAVGSWLAETLGLRPFVLDDARRALYHAGAAIASNYLVTLRRAAGELFDATDVPAEALEPLMRRVIENGFQLTGPTELSTGMSSQEL